MLTRPLPDDPEVRGRDFRRFIHTALGGVRAHAECAQTMAEIGDDDALAYHVEAVENAARLAAAVAEDLRKAKLLALARRAKAIREPEKSEAAA